MKQRFLALEQGFNRLSARERWMVFLATALLFCLFSWTLFISSGLKNTAVLKQKLSDVKQQHESLTTAAAELQQSMAIDIDQPVKDQIRSIQEKLAAQQRELEQSGASLLPPERTGAALQGMLEQTSGLSLIKLTNASAVPVLEEVEGTDDSTLTMEGVPQVYHHPLQLEFEGSYLQTAGYLEQVEKVGLPLFWDRFTLSVKTYPRAHIQLGVHTLSLQQGWLGL